MCSMSKQLTVIGDVECDLISMWDARTGFLVKKKAEQS